jgi:lipid-binding SYLF domain-containing protein
VRRALALLALACCGNAGASDWQPDPQVPMQVAVAETMQQFRASKPELTHFFDEACGIAVFPRVVRAGLVIGGGSGRGLLLSKGAVLGEVRQGALTLGFQTGGQSYGQVILFRTCEAMRVFTDSGNVGRADGRVEFQGRASAQAGSKGAASDPGFIGDVAIFSLARGGLMIELGAGGVRYRFKPAVPASQ